MPENAPSAAAPEPADARPIEGATSHNPTRPSSTFGRVNLRRASLSRLGRAILLSQAFAVLWWLTALWVRSTDAVPVWFDQETIFSQLVHHLADPYQIPHYFNPPWTAVLLAPFGLLPLPLAVLIQLAIYFAALAGLVVKFGGDTRGLIIALTSFIAFDAALELNVEWLVALGLLVAPVWSGPLLLVKPQIALGSWLTLPRPELVRAVVVTLLVGGLSLLAWSNWPARMLANIENYPLLQQSYNLAPQAFLPWPVAVSIGLVLAWRTFRRRDIRLSLLAWLFFVPYITLYGLLIHFTMLTIRQWRFALLVNVSMWLIFGGVLLWALLPH